MASSQSIESRLTRRAEACINRLLAVQELARTVRNSICDELKHFIDTPIAALRTFHSDVSCLTQESDEKSVARTEILFDLIEEEINKAHESAKRLAPDEEPQCCWCWRCWRSAKRSRHVSGTLAIFQC
jgi:hypothetical protein